MLKVLKRVIENVGIKTIKDMNISVHTFKGQRHKRYIVECEQLTLTYNAYLGTYNVAYKEGTTTINKTCSELAEIQDYILTNII